MAFLLCWVLVLFLWQGTVFPVQGRISDSNIKNVGVSLGQPEKTDIPTYNIYMNEGEEGQILQDKKSSAPAGTASADSQTGLSRGQGNSDGKNELSRGLGSSVSKEDLNLLARVIYAEARGEDFEGQIAVGAVVLNRLESSEFPKTIRDVIYQPGAFTAVQDKQIRLSPDETAYQAAEAALAGQDPTGGALYYYNPRTASDRWIKSRPVVKRIGNHTFSI